jgi:transposase-like protein
MSKRSYPLPSPNESALALTSTSIVSRLSTSLNPVNLIEQIIVDELARRVQQMQEFGAAIQTLRQDGEAAMAELLAGTMDQDRAIASARASVIGSERHAAMLRQGCIAARGLYRGLEELGRVRAREMQVNHPLLPDPRYRSEQACCTHLVRRFANGDCACPRCDVATNGYFIPSKLSWQCAQCDTQVGIRLGTCFERSSLPLTKWFFAIRLRLLAPATSTTDLARLLEIQRLQTVRRIAKKIQAALDSPMPSRRLAGLDHLTLGGT